MAFEAGHLNDFKSKFLILTKHVIKMDLNDHKLKLNFLSFEHKISDKISFDGIKRGPLLLLIIGLWISSLILVIELIVYFKSHQINLFC